MLSSCRTAQIAFTSLLTLVAVGLAEGAWAAEIASKEISFNHDVKPILSDRCFHCHGPDAQNQDSEFRLDTEEHAIADLGGYAGIVPGNVEQSEMHQRIWSEDDDVMPPADSNRSLSDDEKRILDAWIQAGAKYEAHWSFVPLAKEIEVPTVESDWPNGEIDRFVFARQQAAGLKPNRAASKQAWLRRVTFDLTGLPPTIDEINAFIEDDSPTAHEEVVDDLLTRISCAERLTTEWLDVARYSDSYGYQRDDPRFVWPWRDWVIDAFHTNMPYDQFILEQLAGDLLPNATREQILATAFNRLHSHKKEGGVAVEEFRVENVADRTHTVGAAFMGLTFECARCHDHKYDPITTKDYYQLSSFFANVDERGLISFFTDAVPTPAMPLPDESQQKELDEAEQAVTNAWWNWTHTEKSAIPHALAWIGGEKAQIDEISGRVGHLSFDRFEAQKSDIQYGRQKTREEADPAGTGELSRSEKSGDHYLCEHTRAWQVRPSDQAHR